MQLPTTTLLTFVLSLASFSNALTPQNSHAEDGLYKREIAAGGGAPGVAAEVQYPTVSNVDVLITIGGKVTAGKTMFTQNFAATALGTWPLGATPVPGVIGLGDIKGEVGKVGR